MKHKNLLLLLADHLAKMDEAEYDMTSTRKGPLVIAANMLEFRKAGWSMAMIENEQQSVIPQPMYKEQFDCNAAALFFDISIIEAEYLFAPCETDIHGYGHPPLNEPTKKHMKNMRDNEPPTLTAARIKAFVTHPGQDFLGRTQAERA